MKLYGKTSRFTTQEFECKCGCGFGSQEKDISKTLILALNKMREAYGKPLSITSGARCFSHNKEQGGARRSTHLATGPNKQCMAADIRIGDSGMRFAILYLAVKIGFSRIGIARSFIHVDVSGEHPHHVAWLY